MPTFHNHSTAVQLSVANIPKVITQNPQPGQCAASTTNIKHVELEFAKASGDGTLAEDALSGDDGKHLDFLGKHQDMPFFMVRVGKDFYNPNATQKTTRRPAKSVKAQISDSTALYDGVDQTEEGKMTPVAQEMTLFNYFQRPLYPRLWPMSRTHCQLNPMRCVLRSFFPRIRFLRSSIRTA